MYEIEDEDEGVENNIVIKNKIGNGNGNGNDKDVRSNRSVRNVEIQNI